MADLVEKALPFVFAVGRIGGCGALLFLRPFLFKRINCYLKTMDVHCILEKWAVCTMVSVVSSVCIWSSICKVDGLLSFFLFFFVFQVANGNYSALFTKRRVSADDVQHRLERRNSERTGRSPALDNRSSPFLLFVFSKQICRHGDGKVKGPQTRKWPTRFKNSVLVRGK